MNKTLALAWLLAVACPAAADTIRVGPQRSIHHISDAARLAKDGDVVEVDAGDYRADVAVWPQRRLTLRGVGGRPRLVAAGASAEGKAIWVIRGEETLVENFAFVGARVVGRNGAGIRFESGKLTVRNCVFSDNEMGILTGNDSHLALIVTDSEFGPNGNGMSIGHNLYAGRIGSLIVTGSYFHHAKIGHLLKTRAAYSLVAYSRLTDEVGGEASYELEFPVGGIAVVVGNIIEQSSTSQNSKIISYGAEGYTLPSNRLFLINNTIVDDKPLLGEPLFVKGGDDVKVMAVNNLLLGGAGFSLPADSASAANHVVDKSDLANPANYDYRLVRHSAFVGQAVAPGQFGGMSLRPSMQYQHPAHSQKTGALALQPGALQTLAP